MKRTINLFEGMFFLLYVLIAFYAIITAAYQQAFSFAFLVTVLFLVFIFMRKPIKLPQSQSKLWLHLYIVVWIFTFIMMLVMSFSLEVKTSWDWGKVVNTAAKYVINNQQPDITYFAKYPNNQFVTFFLICIFQIVHFFFPGATIATMKIVSIIFSCIFVQIGITFIYLTALTLWNRRKAFFVGIVTALYTPIFLYSQFAYTDTFTLPFSASVFYLFAKLYKSKQTKHKYIYCILIGLLAGAGARFKIMSIISFFAVLIALLFNKREKLKKRLIYSAISVISTISVMILIAVPSNLFFNYSAETKDRYEFPPVHWVMMSLNKSGGYIRSDVRYTESFDTYSKKAEKDTELLNKRINDYGFFGLTEHIFCTKLIRTWCDPALGGDNYISRRTIHRNTFLTSLFSKRGSLHTFFLVYMYAFHIILIFGCIFSAVAMLKKKRPDSVIFAGQLSLAGITLFLSIWECNSRYLFTFIPQLLITAIYGTNILTSVIGIKMKKHLSKNTENKSADLTECDSQKE